MAKELGSARSANMVILGAASPYLGIEYEALKDAIKSIFGRKSEEIVKVNLQALEAGRQAAMRKIIA
jgi:indolepyruvate ferredoxin oxidoreductase beta subunit